MASVYVVNKGINAAIEFKGIKAQYIGYLGGGLLVLFIVFVVGYVLHISYAILIPLIFILGTVLYKTIVTLSNKYGAHGMMKAGGYRTMPSLVKGTKRSTFRLLKSAGNNQ
jgi:hypothetical protein